MYQIVTDGYSDIEPAGVSVQDGSRNKRFGESVDKSILGLGRPRYGKRSGENLMKRDLVHEIFRPRYGKRRAGFPLFNLEVDKKSIFGTLEDLERDAVNEGRKAYYLSRGVKYRTHPYLRFATKRSKSFKPSWDDMIRPRYGKRLSFSAVENMIRPRYGKRSAVGGRRSLFSNFGAYRTPDDYRIAYLPYLSQDIFPTPYYIGSNEADMFYNQPLDTMEDDSEEVDGQPEASFKLRLENSDEEDRPSDYLSMFPIHKKRSSEEQLVNYIEQQLLQRKRLIRIAKKSHE